PARPPPPASPGLPGLPGLPEHVLDAVEEVALFLRIVLAARARLELFLRQRFGELLDDLALVARELLRRPHLHGGEQIAAAAAADVGHPLALEPQRRAGLRALGAPDGFRPSGGGPRVAAAGRDGREVDRDLAEQVHAVAAEERVFLHVDDDVEMSGGTAGGAGLAFVLQPQLLTGGDARRNLHGELL